MNCGLFCVKYHKYMVSPGGIIFPTFNPSKVFVKTQEGIAYETDSIMKQPNYSYFLVLAKGLDARYLNVGDVFIASRYVTAHKFGWGHKELGWLELHNIKEPNVEVIATDPENLPNIKQWQGDSPYDMYKDDVKYYE